MLLRKIDMADNLLLRTWRNDNAEFFPPGPKITASMQVDWYREYLNRPEDHQYMVMNGSRPVGTLAIDIRSKVIGRVMRGRPEPKGIMSAAVFELMGLYGDGTYMLQVLESNYHAIEFYQNLGFRPFGWQSQDGLRFANMRTEYHL
jgi:ribosomal protein S18 acetylase RimI-like enzyme